MKNRWVQNMFYLFSLALIGLYTILRAYYVNPIFDETASYFTYFFSGHVWDNQTWVDANNHLLISYLGKFWVNHGLNHFFYFRLISVLGYILYIAAWHIIVVKQLKLPLAKFIVVCVVSIPWLIEYGALARGYAFSMAAFMWLIVLFIEMMKKTVVIKLIAFYVLAWCCIFSSFTFTVPVFLLLGFWFIYFTNNCKHLGKALILFYFVLSALFLIAYWPLFNLSLQLKQGGHLWWGSTEGLWQITGASITQLVLFYDGVIARIFINLLFLLALILFLYQSYQKSLKQIIFGSFLSLITFYTFILLLSIIITARFFNINYPEDRVGMFLVPLFIFLLLYIYSSLNHHRFFVAILLFFPLSLIAHVNFNTTIFSPFDRMTDHFFNQMMQKVPSQKSVSAEWMAFTLYNYECVKFKTPSLIFYKNDFQLNSDYYLTTGYKGFEPDKHYQLILQDSVTQMKLYQFDDNRKLIPIDSASAKHINFSTPESLLFERDSLISPSPTPFCFSIDLNMELQNTSKTLEFHLAFIDADGNYQVLQHINLQNIFYPSPKIEVHTLSPVFKPISAKKIFIKLINPNHVPVHIKTFKITHYSSV